MKPVFRQPKRIGEWVELEFQARAARAGLTISKPYGDSAPFDFIVGRRHPLHRVQVRGTSAFSHVGSYICRVTRGRPPVRYRRSEIDFLAVFVIPCQQWYVIPMDAIPHIRRHISLYPHIQNSRGRLEKYRDAWHLLGGKRRPRSRKKSRNRRPVKC